MFFKKIRRIQKAKLFFVCTGLGIVQRGFEIYIASLADHLKEEKGLDFEVEVYSGARYRGKNFISNKIPTISRKNKLFNKVLGETITAELELLFFFLFFLIKVILTKPNAIYLGEYKIYCYLFKVRKYLSLEYKLIFYTGGQVAPGLFNAKKDFVHHVTDAYLSELIEKGFPSQRQFVLPHFVNLDFKIDPDITNQIKQKAGSKKIILSVGLIDRKIKQMHLFVEILKRGKEKYFPIIIGENSSETEIVRKNLTEYFGKDGFIITKLPHESLGNYYAVADLFILCSSKESFGLVNLEALYFGVPIMVNDFSESRFVLNEFAHYENMNFENLVHLKSIVEQIVNDSSSHNEYTKSARKNFVINKYSWNFLKNSYVDFFNKTLAS